MYNWRLRVSDMYLISSQALIYRYTEAEENTDGESSLREYAYEVSTAIRPQQSETLRVRLESRRLVGSKCVSRNKEKRKRGKMVVRQEEEAGDDNGPRGRG